MTLRLIRPARGGKPAKVYPIDLDAIQDRGDSTANLQIFPGDRLIVDRSAVVKSTMKLNADSARTATLLNNALTYAFTVRNLDRLGEMNDGKSPLDFTLKMGTHTLKINLGDEVTKIDPARRKAALKAWREFWEKNSKAGGPDEQKMLDEMMKMLDK